MPDIINENGLQVATSEEIQTNLENGYKAIYGNDIAITSNTQDGQLIGIYTQMATDIRELLMEVYNSFNPTLCRGRMQDVRFALNDITRKGGTFTIVPITITVNKTVTLRGLDANYNDVNATSYAISDDAGNQYFLIDTVTLTAGTYTKQFRAQNIGLVQPVLNTIINQVTIVNGVTSVTNASAPTSYGVNQETDTEFAIRRERSIENKSQNSIDAIVGQLLEIEGLTQAVAYNHDYTNYPSTTDADGIPIGYIWVIAEGGSNADIATVIYANMAGTGTKGAVNINVPTASGQILTVNFDRPIATPLHIRFNFKHTSPDTFYIAENLIKQYIVDNLQFKINQYADTADITTIAQAGIEANGGNGVCTDLEIWDGQTIGTLSTWNTPYSVSGAGWDGVCYGNNKYIACGASGYITYSNDATTWTSQQVGSGYWYSVVYGNNVYVAVGGSGKIVTSSDGVTWGTPITLGSSDWNNIKFINNKFYAVGSNSYISSSSDGTTWETPIQVTSAVWYDIAFGNNVYVAVGHYLLKAQVTTSTDGVTWTSATQISTNFGLHGVAFGHGKFVAVGSNGYVVTSTDGITWNTPIQLNNNNKWWQEIIYNEACGKFIITSESGYVSISDDGETWETPVQIGSNSWTALTQSTDKILALSSGQTAMYRDITLTQNWTDFIETQTKQNIFTVDTSDITITEVAY